MTWLDTHTLDVGRGQRVTPFWHCFGANTTAVDYQTIVAMLLQSKTALLPVNTHDIEGRGLFIGNGTVTWEKLRHLELVRRMVPCLNINLRTSAKDAVAVTRAAFDLTGIDLLKLEVLDKNDTSLTDDAQVVAAAKTLTADGFRVMPLISANIDTARQLVQLGVPLLRVQGSPIGSGRGVDNPDAVKAIVSLGVPVVLDCGIGHADHVKHAIRLGCRGFLVDWLLFKDGDPVDAIRRLRAELETWGAPLAGSHGDIVDPTWEEWFERTRTAA